MCLRISATWGYRLFWDIWANGSVERHQIDAYFRSDIGSEIKSSRCYSRVFVCRLTSGREYLPSHAKGVIIYKRKVLKLKKTLYLLRHNPRVLWKSLTENLDKWNSKQSELDPCLFFGEKVICIVYVDEQLFWSKDYADITQVFLYSATKESILSKKMVMLDSLESN